MLCIRILLISHMKICNVVNIYFTIPYFLGNQLTYLTNKGHEIHLICSPAMQLPEYAQAHGCKYYEVLISRKFGIVSDLKSLISLYIFIKKSQFDIVCGHTPKAGMLSMIAAFFAGVKKRIYYRHGLVYETASGIKRKILIGCEKIASIFSTKVICVSPYLIEKSLEDKLTNPNKLTILGFGSSTGVDTEGVFNPNNINNSKKIGLRNDLKIPQNAIVLGFVGRMVNDKGIRELVDAFETLKGSYENIYLLIAGPLEERDGLTEDLLIRINNDPRIRHVGLVEKDIQYYYANMDLLVLPTHREGLGMVLLEAQSMGVPVLATSNTGARDALIDGVTGMYIDLNPVKIAQKIEMYIVNSDLRSNHSKNARIFVQERFNQRLVWKEIEKIYEDNSI